mgnify:CR=1 FL=1
MQEVLPTIYRSEASGPTYQGGELMPVRCYTCGNPLQQLLIEDSLNRGVSLAETLDRLGYVKFCCRSKVQAAPVIVELVKRQQRMGNVANQLQRLTLANTAPAFSGPMSLAPISGGIRIVDQAPPINPTQSVPIIGFGETAIETEGGPVNTIDWALSQIEEPEPNYDE